MSALEPKLSSAALILADGSIFPAYSFGYEPKNISDGILGEVVFNTAMTGYQEILTDPSYYGQIVVMTYPHIGNYGINEQDIESRMLKVSGFVVREFSEISSNWRGTTSLQKYLINQKIPALTGVDTRAITRHIRDKGAMNAYIVSPAPKTKEDLNKILKSLQAEAPFGEKDLVADVSCKEPYEWTESCGALNGQWNANRSSATSSKKPLVIVIDLGVKFNMLRSLVLRGCRVKVVPVTMPAEKILELEPQGVLLSNGPGDPAMVKHAPETINKLLGRVPIFGICMGHQVLAHSIGAKTFKMKFGHHGANQPVLDIKSGSVMITSQNHGYAIDPASLPKFARISQINLNDKSVEGIELPEHRAFSVQYHPEACPGPRDSMAYFDDFLKAMQ